MRILVLLLLVPVLGLTQTSDKLNKVVAKLNTVKDYSVDAAITADIPMIKILPSKAKIYFKQKDKFKVESKGIVILPKQGFTDLNQFLSNKNNYLAIEGDTTRIGGVLCRLITVVPTGESEEIILAKVWIDEKQQVITKTRLTTRTNGTVTTTYTYGDMVKYALPSKMVFRIDVKTFKLPKSMAADIHDTDASKKTDKRKNGTITIKLSNYKVNTGLSDAIFQKKKEQK
jgi:outer membrane lipoprotein-sorting protein